MEILNTKANVSMRKQLQQSADKIATTTTNTQAVTNQVGVAFNETKEKSNKSTSPLFGKGKNPLPCQAINHSSLMLSFPYHITTYPTPAEHKSHY